MLCFFGPFVANMNDIFVGLLGRRNIVSGKRLMNSGQYELAESVNGEKWIALINYCLYFYTICKRTYIPCV